MNNDYVIKHHDDFLKPSVNDMIFQGARCIIVLKDKKVLGLITEGDILRSSIKSFDWNPRLSEICNKNYYSLSENWNKLELKKLLLKHKFILVPVTDSQRNMIDILSIWDLIDEE
jgi:predicted transcriptional regulator